MPIYVESTNLLPLSPLTEDEHAEHECRHDAALVRFGVLSVAGRSGDGRRLVATLTAGLAERLVNGPVTDEVDGFEFHAYTT